VLLEPPSPDELSGGGHRHHPTAGDEKSGAIAQLVERFNGIEEVSGSIPLGSTISSQGADEPAWRLGRSGNALLSTPHITAPVADFLKRLDDSVVAPGDLSRACRAAYSKIRKITARGRRC
jgi:hypothetical protein